MVKIEVFVLPGCSRCNTGLGVLKEVAESFGCDCFSWDERDLLQNIDYAVQLGILSSPAIAIDGRLAFTSLPSPQQLRSELTKYIDA